MKWGIIGRNFVVDWMMEALRSLEGMEPVAIYSRRLETGEEFAQKYGLEKVYTDLDAMAEDPALEAIYIASPVCCHAEQSIRMLSHGKHVLCEKPAASNKSELEAILKTASEHGVVWLEAMRPVFDDLPQILRAYLKKIGTLRSVRVEFCQYSSRYDRFQQGEILNAFDPSLSNAALMDLGCYCIHLICHLFGMPKSVVSQSVFLKNGFEGMGMVLMNYGGFLAEASYGKIFSQGTPSVFCGEKGCILVDDFTLNRPKITFLPRGGDPESVFFNVKAPNNFVCEAEAFRQCVMGERSAQPYQDTSRMVMDILDDIRRQNGIHFSSDK